MFGILMRKKLSLEDNVKRVQNKYLDQLKVYRLNCESDPQQVEKIKLDLSRKEEAVVAILNEYKESLKQLQDLSEVISSAYSSAMDINAYLDQLVASLGNEYSNEIKMESAELAKQIAARDEQENDEEQSKVEDDGSDKENSYIAAEEAACEDSPVPEYLSPNLQCRRTFDQSDAFTPALKKSTQKKLH